MAKIYEKAYFGDKIIPFAEANLSVASSAVLYGLSVYTVFHVSVTEKGAYAFRLRDHYQRLINSARVIGIDTFEKSWTYEKFEKVAKEIISVNKPTGDVFARVTVHVSDLVAGTKSRGLNTLVSIFLYEAKSIVPQDGARLKTSVWRRVPDCAIPSRAKVNGAYVNSVLGKQDALDSGYDDCIFLDMFGHVCELSAANIFIVRDGVLITPDTASDLLEGINRRTVLDLARDMNIKTVERNIDLTELYIADEVFASGTSAFIAPVKEIDSRVIGDGKIGPITAKLREKRLRAMRGEEAEYMKYLTAI